MGNPVNNAAHVESFNAEWGTDILVTGNTWSLIKDKFITIKTPPVTIEGVGAINLYAIINTKAANPEEQKGPRTIGELRGFLNIKVPDNKQVLENE